MIFTLQMTILSVSVMQYDRHNQVHMYLQEIQQRHKAITYKAISMPS